jgi:uncharacterized protein (DUF1810 family)
MGRLMQAHSKRTTEMVFAQPHSSRQILTRQSIGKRFFDILLYATHLPWRQAASLERSAPAQGNLTIEQPHLLGKRVQECPSLLNAIFSRGVRMT